MTVIVLFSPRIPQYGSPSADSKWPDLVEATLWLDGHQKEDSREQQEEKLTMFARKCLSTSWSIWYLFTNIT